MDQFEETVTLLVAGIAVPLASFIAVAVGCGDSTAKKRSQKQNATSKRRAKRNSSKSSKRSRSSKSRSKSKIRRLAAAKKSADHSAVALKTAKQATSSQFSVKPAVDAKQSGSVKRVSSKSKRTSSRSSSRSSKRRSGSKRLRAQKRSSLSSSKRRLSSKRRSSSKRRGSKSKPVSVDAKKSIPADKSISSRSKSVKKAALSQNMTEKNYVPVGASKLSELRVTPEKLNFGIKGGQLILNVINSSPIKRFAVKVKCSDNQLYRVNPVFAFVEPNQNVLLTVYRHNGASKIDKLVIVTTEATNEEANPKDAFKDPNAICPMMVVPLNVHGDNIADLDVLQRAPCTCSVNV